MPRRLSQAAIKRRSQPLPHLPAPLTYSKSNPATRWR
jgi:hypothetical protein